MNKAIVMLVFTVVISFGALAQVKDQLPAITTMTPKRDIICYGKPEDQFTIVEPPAAYKQWKTSKAAKTGATTFQVEYVNFPDDAKAAFQKAVDIWSTLLESDVTIRIRAEWGVIVDGTGSTNTILGGASPATYIRDFDGAQQRLTWYPVALAEKMAGEDLNDPADPDIFAQFNSANLNWSFSTDGVPQPGKTDLVSVVLHEIGHGLGITKTYEVEGTNGIISASFSPLHVIYDHFVENSGEKNLVQNYVPPSSQLKTELTSDQLYFRTPQLTIVSALNDNRAKIFAPSTFQPGSSIAHLDEVFYNNTPNALMTPQIANAEILHNPGPIAMKMLADMGWVNARIIHTKLPNTEDQSNPYIVVAQIKADQMNGYNYNASEVKLNYTTDGTTFTVVPMTATGNANEFSASIPAAGAGPLKQYGYYISVKDNLNRTILNPGIYTEDGKKPVNLYFVFEAGPDTEPPVIDHTPKPYLLVEDTQLVIEADITDNIGILQTTLEYQINGAVQTPLPLTLKAGSESIYTATITLPTLQDGDQVKYRINAKDNSLAKNEASAPSTTEFYILNVVSLGATKDSYTNNFNSATTDFFGDNLFSINTPTGFSNGAIHTSHPYPVGSGADFTSEFIYQLKYPIRLKSNDATIKFDEIVLVEPGDAGSTFGSNNFYDYVVVEGSKDGGITWKPLADGYDSRDNAVWLTRFNSSSDSANPPNSTAAGDPTLFKTRIIDMLGSGNFAAGDEVAIRFRLYTDQLVYGWGWAIDNLKIQVDETPPTILHNHYNYFNLSTPTLSIVMNVTDNVSVDKLFVDYRIIGGTIITEELPVTQSISQYTFNLSISGLVPGELVEYRIRSVDNSGNESALPAADFFKAPAINFGQPVTQYINDFNSTSGDFVGNFFSIATPTSFSNGAIHSTHPYLNGFGLTNSTSSYSYTLTKPVTISATNPYIMFSEIAVVEYVGSAVKDFVVVEGSKDNGATWEAFGNSYAANANSTWKSIFDAGGSATSSNYVTRIINMTSSGKFAAGDNVIIRFRMSADNAVNGWGWSIDNLSIQGPVTGVEKTLESTVSVYPNPVLDGRLLIEVAGNQNSSNAALQIINMQGKSLIADSIALVNDTNVKEYKIEDWPDGMYLVRIDLGNNQLVTKKFIKSSK